MSYGDGAHNEFFINEAPDSAQLVDHLKAMAFHGGAADAAEAVRFAYRVSNINHGRNSINQSIFQVVQFCDRWMVNLTKARTAPYSVKGKPPPRPPPPLRFWDYTNLGYVVLHMPRPWTDSRKPAEKAIETTELIMHFCSFQAFLSSFTVSISVSQSRSLNLSLCVYASRLRMHIWLPAWSSFFVFVCESALMPSMLSFMKLQLAHSDTHNQIADYSSAFV